MLRTFKFLRKVNISQRPFSMNKMKKTIFEDQIKKYFLILTGL